MSSRVTQQLLVNNAIRQVNQVARSELSSRWWPRLRALYSEPPLSVIYNYINNTRGSVPNRMLGSHACRVWLLPGSALSEALGGRSRRQYSSYSRQSACYGIQAYVELLQSFLLPWRCGGNDFPRTVGRRDVNVVPLVSARGIT